MSVFDFERSLTRATLRLGDKTSRRKVRADRGQSRLPADVLLKLRELIGDKERPKMTSVLRELSSYCRAEGHRVPSRGAVYQALKVLPGPSYRVRELSPAVRAVLYNFTDDTVIPASQLAFYCLNYGDLPALSFAAGLPWLALYQASRQRGFREKSHGLVDAILRARRA